MRLLFYLFCLSLLFSRSYGEEAPSLASFGFSDDAEGARRCLQELAWTESREIQFKQLIAELSDDRYGIREAAMAQLIALPALPRERLRQMAKNRDQDFRQRIDQVLSVNSAKGIERLFQAALERVLNENPHDWVRRILLACPSVPEPERRVWELALRVAERGEKVAVEDLYESLESLFPLERVVAATALHRQCGKEAWSRLLPLLSDPNDRVRLQVALLAVEDQEPACVPVLLDLLKSEEVSARFKSLSALRQLTGRDFGYKATALPESREEGVAQWRNWYETEGNQERLKFPGA